MHFGMNQFILQKNMKQFKFFQKNPYKDKCRLQVGASFIFKGDYCVVTDMGYNGFGYFNQDKPNTECYMTYRFYLTTPSAAGRQLNRSYDTI